MSREFRIAAVLLTSAFFAFGGLYAKTHAARADGGAGVSGPANRAMPQCLVHSGTERQWGAE